MNLNQIMNMVMRIVLRKGVNWGIAKGTQVLARRGGPAPAKTPPAGPAASAHSQQAREAAKRARKAAAITRRLGR